MYRVSHLRFLISVFVVSFFVALSLLLVSPLAHAVGASDAPCFKTTSSGGGKTITFYYDYEYKSQSKPACSKDVEIPETIDGETVIAIGSNAFQNASITSVEIPDSVTSIGETAFTGNTLHSVTIPGSVKTIGRMAFSEVGMTSLTLGGGVEKIGGQAFASNNLKTLTLPDSVTSIGARAFTYNDLESITLSDALTSIGDGAFSVNKLTTLTIPDSVTSIGTGAFSGNDLTSLTIPNSVTTIGPGAFNGNDLTTLTIPSSVASIGQSAFANNKLTSLHLKNGLEEIGSQAFMGNSLQALTIPDSVTTLGDRPFLIQTDPSGADYADYVEANLTYGATSSEAQSTAQNAMDHLFYVNLFIASSTQAGALGLNDAVYRESDLLFLDANGNGTTTDIISGILVNPAPVTLSYQDENGKTLKSSETLTGDGLRTYLVRGNPSGDTSRFYHEGDTFDVPDAPSISGYTFTSASVGVTTTLTAGNNTIVYTYKVKPSSHSGSFGTSYLPGYGPSVGSGTTNTDKQALITKLQTQIASLRAQISALVEGGIDGSTVETGTGTFNFTRDLTVGDTGSDVKTLQHWLNTHGFPVALKGAGSLGHETSYYGYRTRQAVMLYQSAHGIEPNVGYFGPLTRARVERK